MKMPDYKEMYLKMMRATEKAMDILIEPQRECEEMYIRAEETPLILLFETDKPEENPNQQTSTKIK